MKVQIVGFVAAVVLCTSLLPSQAASVHKRSEVGDLLLLVNVAAEQANKILNDLLDSINVILAAVNNGTDAIVAQEVKTVDSEGACPELTEYVQSTADACRSNVTASLVNAEERGRNLSAAVANNVNSAFGKVGGCKTVLDIDCFLPFLPAALSNDAASIEKIGLTAAELAVSVATQNPGLLLSQIQDCVEQNLDPNTISKILSDCTTSTTTAKPTTSTPATTTKAATTSKAATTLKAATTTRATTTKAQTTKKHSSVEDNN